MDIIYPFIWLLFYSYILITQLIVRGLPTYASTKILVYIWIDLKADNLAITKNMQWKGLDKPLITLSSQP